jgi:magnesium transporter
MQENEVIQPWDRISKLLQQEDRQLLEDYIESISARDLVRALSHMNMEEQTRLLSLLSPDYSAYLLEEIPEVQASKLIRTLPVAEAAVILNEMQSSEQADLLAALSEVNAEAILAEMKPEEAEDARMLLSYEPDEAGGLMITEYLSFLTTATVKDVVDNMTQNADTYSDYHVQYLYVISKDGKLEGVLRIRDLLLSKPATVVSSIMIRNPLCVTLQTGLDTLLAFFDDHEFFGVPVVDEQLRMRGVVLRRDVLEAAASRADSEHMRTQGIIGGEELRTMPVLLRSRRRLSWLSVNILLNIVAASVIALYQDTLSSVIALAVFLPIISDMSGCSGNQAVAVSMRELSLNIVKPFEVFRVWWQEISVGLINGTVLGILVGMAAWLWKGNLYLGLVVGGALAVNTLVAVSIGGAIPLILKRIGMDPALASSPILTTITDMFGFFLVLSFATAVLPLLN